MKYVYLWEYFYTDSPAPTCSCLGESDAYRVAYPFANRLHNKVLYNRHTVYFILIIIYLAFIVFPVSTPSKLMVLVLCQNGYTRCAIKLFVNVPKA